MRHNWFTVTAQYNVRVEAGGNILFLPQPGYYDQAFVLYG